MTCDLVIYDVRLINFRRVAIATAAIGLPLLLAIFIASSMFRDEIAGSDRAALDRTNEETMSTIAVMPDAILIEKRIHEEIDRHGELVRYFDYRYVTAQTAMEVRVFYAELPEYVKIREPRLTICESSNPCDDSREGVTSVSAANIPRDVLTTFIITVGQRVVPGLF